MRSPTDAAEYLMASAHASSDSDWLSEWHVPLALLLNLFRAQGIEYVAGRINAITPAKCKLPVAIFLLKRRDRQAVRQPGHDQCE